MHVFEDTHCLCHAHVVTWVSCCVVTAQYLHAFVEPALCPAACWQANCWRHQGLCGRAGVSMQCTMRPEIHTACAVPINWHGHRDVTSTVPACLRGACEVCCSMLAGSLLLQVPSQHSSWSMHRSK